MRLPFLTAESLMEPGKVHYIGHPPLRVDFLNEISGVEFEVAWEKRIDSNESIPPFSILSLEHLIQNKRASGRTKDLADVEALETLARERKTPPSA